MQNLNPKIFEIERWSEFQNSLGTISFICNLIDGEFQISGRPRKKFAKVILTYPISPMQSQLVKKTRSVLEINKFIKQNPILSSTIYPEEPQSLGDISIPSPPEYNSLSDDIYNPLYQAFKIRNAEISSSSSFNYFVGEQKISFELLQWNHKKNVIELELSSPISLKTDIHKIEASIKKIFLKTDSETEKLKNIAQNIQYNLDDGKRKFDIEVGKGKEERRNNEDGTLTLTYIERTPVDFYEELELKLEDFPNLVLRGEKTKPGNPLQKECPQCNLLFDNLLYSWEGKDYCSQVCVDNAKKGNGGNDIPQLRNQTITDIQAELDKKPEVKDNELGSYSDWKNKINGLNDEGKINSFKGEVISEINKIRTSKEGNNSIKQTIDNLTDQDEKIRAEQLWRKLIDGEELVKEGKFSQQIYELLTFEKQSNSKIYQILNLQERVDNLLKNLEKTSQIIDERGKNNNQQNQQNGNSSLKMIIGVVAVVLVIFYENAIEIWKVMQKKKKKL